MKKTLILLISIFLIINLYTFCTKEDERDFFIGEWVPKQDNEYTKIYESENQISVVPVYNKLFYNSDGTSYVNGNDFKQIQTSEKRTIIESDGDFYIRFVDSEPNCTLHLNIFENELMCDGSYYIENPGSEHCSKTKIVYSNISAKFENDTLWERGEYENFSNDKLYHTGYYKAYFVKRMKTTVIISETK